MCLGRALRRQLVSITDSAELTTTYTQALDADLRSSSYGFSGTILGLTLPEIGGDPIGRRIPAVETGTGRPGENMVILFIAHLRPPSVTIGGVKTSLASTDSLVVRVQLFIGTEENVTDVLENTTDDTGFWL
jgi:hypothetical protein